MPDDLTPRRWGYIDIDGAFVPVPKGPLQMGGLVPPVAVELHSGRRLIIEEPQPPDTEPGPPA